MSEYVIDTSVAHPARRYNYWLGGKDNYAADRESGDKAKKAFPGIVITVRKNRAFLRSAVTFAAAELGIRQFLDIGTGLPTADNTHEVAQRVHPDARVVYVDNDPLVLVYARALLTSGPEGRTEYIHADLRDPQGILAHDLLRDTLDLSQPVALGLVAVLHFVPGQEAHTVVKSLLEPLAPGSCLIVSHGCLDHIDPGQRAALDESKSVDDVTSRSRDEIAGFFTGTDLVDPGLTLISRWRPEPDADIPADDQVAGYGGVGIKRASS
ncbi:SAM-dependent methyltransferase [Actinoplanes sp. NPDC089786]|uniref:SAM-dependent methyltransferase n=1 Tax=Actinoplanes sp. NPDC089786 TaxID=3155185 RepID=UPI0034419928